MAPSFISDILKEVSGIDEVSKKITRMKTYVYLLQQELKKVDVFHCELPICKRLLKDAIERMEEEGDQCKAREVTKEFLSMCIDSNKNLRGSSPNSSSHDPNDKKNWLKSAQLWSTPIDQNQYGDNPKLEGECGYDNSSGDKGKEIMCDDLSLGLRPMGGRNNSKNGHGASSSTTNSSKQKKIRRCWSCELHEQFVNAVQHLGGAHAATPRQIRDIMQMADLTNDEVKSHLQKYRIHLRRVASSSNAPPTWRNDSSSNTNHVPSGSSQTHSLQVNGSTEPVLSARVNIIQNEETEEDVDDMSEKP